ncbi:MAG: POTRA domain-containing protein, partial [Gimesia chilikensis]
MSLLWLSVFSLPASGQVVPPGAEPGRIEERFEDISPPRAEPTVRQGLESTMPAAEAASIKLIVRQVNVAGSSVFSDAELQPFYADIVGREVTLLEVFEVAARITAH